ncbi:hypothetical protein HZ326_4222 [Fusarium oxysporum f. sp. albedinis]|nr:hypothetical protein HZ326_4222 [Fusarium oxysporum f. sp. albedinis]
MGGQMCCLQLRSVAESLYQHRELSIWEAQCKQRGDTQRHGHSRDLGISGTADGYGGGQWLSHINQDLQFSRKLPYATRKLSLVAQTRTCVSRSKMIGVTSASQ